MIVDTHTHVVSPDEQRYPLHPAGLDQGTGTERRPAAWYREVPVSAERLLELMPAAGVERALLVQAMGLAWGDHVPGPCAPVGIQSALGEA